jgi:hypothetical protein
MADVLKFGFARFVAVAMKYATEKQLKREQINSIKKDIILLATCAVI